ncbi:MAG TPA: GNAT family N-acetyltransferase [Burkholderiaceae bacterium]|nr:GNAT family N-acetyltransferase [Burkholderiaceae bacterium]
MTPTDAPRRPAGLEIRPVTDEDRDAWMPLWRGYQAFYRVDLAEAVTDLTWQRFLDPDEPMHAVLAWQGERAVGLVHWIFHRSCWTTGDYCYLNDLFAEPDTRGTGVGRALIEHVYRQAEAAGCSRVYWLTHETNEVAMRLYDRIAERSGFVQYRKAMPARG